MQKPLEGITVTSVSTGVAGPFATGILADMGARVIKIEDVPNGDFVRGTRFEALGVLPPCDINYTFEGYNRSKQSVAVNLRHDAGKKIVYRLAKLSDIFVSNLRQKTLKEWGMDYESLAGLNPRLIYASVSGYGPKGPDKDLPSYDLAAQGRGGLLSAIGEGDAPPPPWGVPWLADSVAGIQLALGIATALVVRERTGIGQAVDTSLIGGQFAIAYQLLNGYLLTGQEPRRLSRKTTTNPLRNSYQASDGKWFSLNMTVSDRYWATFCRVLGISELIDDPRFNSDPRRSEHCAELISILDTVFATKPRSEWVQASAEHGLVLAPIYTYSDVASDPQALENEYITTFDHPTYGPIKQIGNLINFSRTPPDSKAAAPEYGQHTEEVLLEVGYNWEEIRQLKDEGTII